MQTAVALQPIVVAHLQGPVTLLVEHVASSTVDRISATSEGVTTDRLGRPHIFIPEGDEASVYYSHRLDRWVVLSVGPGPDQGSLDRWGADGGAPCVHPRTVDGCCGSCGEPT